MKTFVALLLSCASLLADDTSIRLTTSTTTNKISGSITTEEVFTRNGDTNLVRQTTVTGTGAFRCRVHMFYRDGARLAVHVVTTNSPMFLVDPGNHYGVSLEFSASNEVQYLDIATNVFSVDGFGCTNGIFSPAEASRIHQRNVEMGELLPVKK